MSDKNLVTADFILQTLNEWVEEKHPIGPDVWLDASAKLAVLLGFETDKLWVMQQNVAKLRVLHIESGASVAKADALIEAEDIYREMQKQKAKIDQIHELIKISKLQARLALDEQRAQ